MYIVAHNLVGMNANRQLNMVTASKQKTSEKLASGYAINRAADDAAGLSISEKMRAQIRGLNRGAQNIEDGVSYVQVADGALNEVHAMLQRMNELSVQAANGTNSTSDREAIDNEIQQLKTEMQRVFTDTAFNEQKIWPDRAIGRKPVKVGVTQVQGVDISTPSSQRITVVNSNYDKVAAGRYNVLADQQGVSLSWIDYDGEQHNTKKIDWTSLQQNNYSFQIADYFDETDTELFEGGVGVFDFKVSLAVEKEAVIDDIIAAINNTYMSVTTGAYITSRFENATGAESRPNGVTTYASINYPATYASREYAHQVGGQGYDYGSECDLFIEAKPVTAKDGNLSSGPVITTVDAARTSNEIWTFKFDMAGVGEVSATSVDVSYSSGERSEGTKDLWWYYYKDTSGNLVKLGKSISSKEYGNGTLGSVMACLTGGKNSATPGLLSSEGLSTCGGSIAIRFDLKATNAFQYGDGSSSTSVGSLTINIAVTDGDDEASVLEKIKQALNDETILDLYKGPYASEAYQTVWKSSAKTSLVERDVFRDELSYGNVSLNIHAGPSTKDKIYLEYLCLRVEGIGLEQTNTRTEDDADQAMKDVARAIGIISEQRSLFGAYQNRMEHARNINENTAENTTAAESRIRDTDMAKTMVQYSKENILQQMGQTILAQANASNEGVLQLLS